MKLKLWLLVAVAMLAVPLRMVWQHEQVMRQGKVFLFKTAPIDPRDPFRGEYVRLSFDAEQGPWTCEGWAERKGRADLYAELGRDPDGFAMITGLSLQRPADAPYVPVKASRNLSGSNMINRVDLPFDRFYMQEGQGARTERLLTPDFRNRQEPEAKEAWAVVRVRNGRAVVMDLVVEGRPIKEWMGEE